MNSSAASPERSREAATGATIAPGILSDRAIDANSITAYERIYPVVI
jgi:hypothetical protein